MKLPTRHDLNLPVPQFSSRTMPSADLAAGARAQAGLGEALSRIGAGLIGQGMQAGEYRYDAALSTFKHNEIVEMDNFFRGLEFGAEEGAVDSYMSGLVNRGKSFFSQVPGPHKPKIDSQLTQFANSMHLQAREKEQGLSLSFIQEAATKMAMEGVAAATSGVGSLEEGWVALQEFVGSAVASGRITPWDAVAILRTHGPAYGQAHVDQGGRMFEVNNVLDRNTRLDWTKEREGFEPGPYMDKNNRGENAGWRIGYGSSTVTHPDGSVEKVTAATGPITKEDAQRDLVRRLETEFGPQVARKTFGKDWEDAWSRVPEPARWALEELAYNKGTGNIPDEVFAAVRAGDYKEAGRLVSALSHGETRNNNKIRRLREGSLLAAAGDPYIIPAAGSWQQIAVDEEYRKPGHIRRRAVAPQTDQWARLAAVSLSQQTGRDIGLVYTSGGQPSKASGGGPRTGSTRHDDGGAVDLVLVVDGKRVLPSQDPKLYQQYLKFAVAHGATGVGHYANFVHVGGGELGEWGPNGSRATLDKDYEAAIAEGRAMQGNIRIGKPLAVMAGPGYLQYVDNATLSSLRTKAAKLLHAEQVEYVVEQSMSAAGDDHHRAIDIVTNSPHIPPAVREDALEMVRLRVKDIENRRAADEEKTYRAAFQEIMSIHADGKPNAIERAIKAIPDGLSPQKQAELTKLAREGPPQYSTPSVYNENFDLAHSDDPNDRRAFLHKDFRTVAGLSDEDRETFIKMQKDRREKVAAMEPDSNFWKVFDQLLGEQGIEKDKGGQWPTSRARTVRELQGLAEVRYRQWVETYGKAPRPEEERDILYALFTQTPDRRNWFLRKIFGPEASVAGLAIVDRYEKAEEDEEWVFLEPGAGSYRPLSKGELLGIATKDIDGSGVFSEKPEYLRMEALDIWLDMFLDGHARLNIYPRSDADAILSAAARRAREQ